MTRTTKTLTSQEVTQALERISPLELPGYLEQVEFYDMQDSQALLNKAVKKLARGGGVASCLSDSVARASVHAVVMAGLKKWNKPEYKRALKHNLHFGDLVEQVRSFSYPRGFSTLAVDQVQDNAQLQRRRRRESRMHGLYDRSVYNDQKAMNRYRDGRMPDGDQGARDDIRGFTVYKTQKRAAEDGRVNHPTHHRAEVDHVIPLKKLHARYESFATRFVDDTVARDIYNGDHNFQLLTQHDNRSKRDKSNLELGRATKERYGALDMSAQDKLEANQRKAELNVGGKLVSAGCSTVLASQTGRVALVIIGPVSYELREMFARGRDRSLGGKSTFAELQYRLKRAFNYISQELPKLLGDFFCDLSQMLLSFAAMLVKSVLSLFTKVIEIIVDGFGMIVQAIRILMTDSSKMTGMQKADAVSKLLVAIVTNVIGTRVVDGLLNSLGVPDPLSDMLATVATSVLAAVVTHLFDTLDLFGVKAQVREQRLAEVFAEKIAKIRENTNNLNRSANETLRRQRLEFEMLRRRFSETLKTGNMESLNRVIDKMASFFKVEIPYSSPEEFSQFISVNKRILICAR